MRYFWAAMKYIGDDNGMMWLQNFNTPRDYIDFILERKDLRHWKAPVTHEKFYDMLGYYSPFEILPSEKSGGLLSTGSKYPL